MDLTTETIINAVCLTLQLDRDVLTSPKLTPELTNKIKEYRDAKLICTHIMRRKIFETKVIMGATADKKRAKMEVDKPITYQNISYVFKRKKAQTAMWSELKCIDLLKTDKAFKQKYEMVVNLLDSNVNSTQ